MPDGVSVIICCYNSAQRLPETLRHLAAQVVHGNVRWEVVVVDNASKDETAATAQRCWPASAPAQLRVVHEPEAGLSHARLRGIREAQYDVISFVDDDNWVAADWVERVHALFSNHPDLGASGGRIEAVCEITPPAWFESVKVHYAIGRQHPQSGDVTDTPGTLLWGAGLSLRAEAMRQLLEDGFTFKMSDRKGKLMSSGGDTEICFALRAAGWRFWYDDERVLQHFIPKERLQWEYARGLMRGLGESSALITIYVFALNSPPFENYAAWKKSWLFQFLKALRQYLGAILSHPESSFQTAEGSLPALAFGEREKPRLPRYGICAGTTPNCWHEIREGRVDQACGVSPKPTSRPSRKERPASCAAESRYRAKGSSDRYTRDRAAPSP